jgi:Rieske Fe-S protein
MLGTVKGVPVAVVRTGRRTYRAIDLRCTHQGVTVGKSGSAWLCPAHGSRFAVDGTVTGGPAQRSLNAVRSVLADGRLTVG